MKHLNKMKQYVSDRVHDTFCNCSRCSFQVEGVRNHPLKRAGFEPEHRGWEDCINKEKQA